MIHNLLARYAESLFWMARYMERAENLARILGVHEFQGTTARGQRDWYSIVRLNADEQRFATRYPVTTAQNVVNFYLSDGNNPTSIISAVRMARDNARTMRPWISTEMWSQINVFHNRMLALTAEDVRLPNLVRTCAAIKEACQTHTGITEGTFYQDEGWYHYRIGKLIERADQTTRLLDIHYHAVVRDDGAAGHYDVVRWHAVLRSAAGYHAFRRVYPRGMGAAQVAAFMLFNESFPRSVAVCVAQINGMLARLKSHYLLRGGNGAMEKVDEIQATLARPVERVLDDGLHSYLDWLQCRFADVTSELGRDFFGHGPPATSP